MDEKNMDSTKAATLMGLVNTAYNMVNTGSDKRVITALLKKIVAGTRGNAVSHRTAKMALKLYLRGHKLRSKNQLDATRRFLVRGKSMNIAQKEAHVLKSVKRYRVKDSQKAKSPRIPKKVSLQDIMAIVKPYGTQELKQIGKNKFSLIYRNSGYTDYIPGKVWKKMRQNIKKSFRGKPIDISFIRDTQSKARSVSPGLRPRPGDVGTRTDPGVEFIIRKKAHRGF